MLNQWLYFCSVYFQLEKEIEYVLYLREPYQSWMGLSYGVFKKV